MPTLNLGVLVSGTGSNLQAILDAIACRKLDASVRLVISNKPGVLAIERARRAGVATEIISHRSHPSRDGFDRAIAQRLAQAGAEWIVLAGFMRVIGPGLLDAFPSRIINIHPALLPAFAGIDAQRQALAYGVKVSGCTVHFVDRGTDTGPIIAQTPVPVLPDDTRDSLAARILEQEHALLVKTLQWIAADQVRIVDDQPRPRVVAPPTSFVQDPR